MDKETQEKLDSLEREIWREDKDLSDILNDDVLKDVNELLQQEEQKKAAQQPEEPQPAADESDDEDEDNEDEDEEENEMTGKDRLTIALLITASVLCIGIIGVMIYWLENFL
jgi:hypothetical protein